MKVLWLTNSPGNSTQYLGDEFVGSSWIPALDRIIQTKIDLHIAFPYPKITDIFKYGGTTYHPIGRSNWKVHAILSQFWSTGGGKHEINTFLRIVDEIKPDIIHVHGTENMFGRIIPLTKIPVVVSLQGCLTVIGHKFFGDYSTKSMVYSIISSSLNIKKILFHKSFIRIQKEMKVRAKAEREILKSTKNIIGRTSWDRRILSVLSPQSVYFHCDEIMRQSFRDYRWQYKSYDKLIIHSTIKNIPYKGFLTICEALYELLNIIDVEVEWRIAGLIESDTIINVTRKEMKLRFPKKGLIYLGLLDEIELANSLMEAHIFVMPSHIENGSNSLCEAMLLGMPCISTFAGGIGSSLKDGEEGILIQDGDPWALAGAIVELHKNHELAIRYGHNARQRALERHDPEKIAAHLVDIYKTIIDDNKKQ